jgi:hypothetical protein
MSTCNELETIDMVELGRNLVPKQPSRSTRTNSPRLDIFGVAPHKIAEGTLVRNLLGSCYDTNLVNCSDLGTQPAVDAENLPVNNGCQNQEVEYLTTSLPDRGVAILLLALFVETVDLSDLARLMVASDKDNSVGIPKPEISYFI